MSAYQTTTDRAAIIRKELKSKHGWTSRDVSVRADYYSMGSSIRVVIKNADVQKDAVKAIAEAHESIDRDAYGDILSGGNRYVDVSYNQDACDVLRARTIDVVRKAAAELATVSENCMVDIDGTPYLLGNGQHGRSYGFSIWGKDAGGHLCETMTVEDAALYVAIGGWSR